LLIVISVEIQTTTVNL